MKRFYLLVVVLLFGVNSASACSRCGNFRSCRFVQHQAAVVAPVVVADSPDVYVIQNSYPQPLVAQGTSAVVSNGGYQASVLPLLDPNLYFSQEMQLLKAASDANAIRSERTSRLFERIAEFQAPAVNTLAAGQALQMVIDPQKTTQQLSTSEVVIRKDAYGRLKLEVQESTQQVLGNQPTDQSATAGKYSYLNTFCAKCHGLDLAEPSKGLYLGLDNNVAQNMRDKYFTIKQAINSGKMPPADFPQQPSVEERQAILNEIDNIIGSSNTH